MAYHVTCPQSGVSVTVQCACQQVGHNPAVAGFHHERCQMNNLTSNVRCPAEAGCCQEPHDHEAAANACEGGHGDCPEPSTCQLWAGVKAHWRSMLEHQKAATPDQLADPVKVVVAPDTCPGGHCHADIDGCTVCHPLVITAGEGAAVLRPVVAA